MKYMKFEVDSQTKKDLEIFETVKEGLSVVGLFNHTQCIGGKKKLYEYLANPLADYKQITERKETIAFFHKHFPNGLNNFCMIGRIICGYQMRGKQILFCAGLPDM